ncbi:acyl-CoA thioesterase/bile acid-CoA:amino acid N-acyltransferase family protein [Bordetella genomosp. 13]|uniref:Palmitoyl-CoA hydrolase n=1 Tax=Bordetella genomosp. 13 TaxID=463040 RepID=A0A1W6ZBF0_9BORD|nr:acyl-CoA thioesterase/bile acid-CoA:amino acid N-acyltransferase family protein [Bordetella genomosp. 13]ARP94480.1 palmitoyl-CoA hydrolase [Bordetella genomosp. 13]
MPAIQVTPAVALSDVSRRIQLTGFPADAEVRLTATSRQPDGGLWQSQAVYRADSTGTVDVSAAAPLSGSYQGVDGGGPLWSQAPLGAEVVEAAAALPKSIGPGEAVVVSLEASAGAQRAEATLTQVYADQGVTRREVRGNGLVGSLYTPATPGPHPAIVVLNGSGGGINESRAALFASRGYAALALGYFGAPGLPSHISQTPLEYFEKGLQWLRDEVRPAHGFIAVSGQSRGGELSLLLGATYPGLVSAVIGYVPSSVVHSVLNAGRPGEGRFAPTWMLRGEPVPHVWQDNAATDWSGIDSLPEPRRQAQAFVDAQRDAAAVARARIPVERIAGPVLLISGGDDGYWPSTAYSREVAQALREAHHPYPVEHLDYPDAGHAIQAPNVPTTEIAKAHAVSGIVLTGGGTALANARANAESWEGVLRFLKEAVAARAAAAAR